MNHLLMLSFLLMVFIFFLCRVLLIITLAFYPSLLVDEVDDSIGVDDTVERVDDDLNFPPQNPVIQAPIVSQLIDQTNSPTLSLDTSSKTGDSPETSNTSLVGGNEFSRYSFIQTYTVGVIFAALVGIIFFVVKGSLNGIDRQRFLFSLFRTSPLSSICLVTLLFRILKMDNDKNLRSEFRCETGPQQLSVIRSLLSRTHCTLNFRDE